MAVLIDTNVFLALIDPTDIHHAWADEVFAEYKASSPPLIMSDIVYSESSVAMNNLSEMNSAVGWLGIDRLSPSDAALFRAGKAFKQYKTVNKGPKNGLLPDFLIGAMAEALGIPIITADPKHYRGYFDNLNVIEPPAPAVAVPAQGIVLFPE